MSSPKLFFYFLKALHHNFFQLWADDTSAVGAVWWRNLSRTDSVEHWSEVTYSFDSDSLFILIGKGRSLDVSSVILGYHDDRCAPMLSWLQKWVVFSPDDNFLAEANYCQSEKANFIGVVYAHKLRVSVGDCIRDLEIIAKAGHLEELTNL